MNDPSSPSGAPPALIWQVTKTVGALTDGERHIGHILKTGSRWHAFDAMHRDPSGIGFRQLGNFATVEAAQQAVEDAWWHRRDSSN